MRVQRGKILLIAGGIVALIVICAVAALLLFDINKFKSSIEVVAFDAIGLDVRINGKMGLSFSPLGISARDVHVANRDGEILSVENLKLGLELMPLLKKQIAITGCELVTPAVNIVKDTEGRYNFEKTEMRSMKWKLKADGLKYLKLSHGALIYLDQKTGKKAEMKDFNLAIKDLSLGKISVDTLKNASFAGTVDCKEIREKDLRIANLRATVKASRGVYAFQPLAIGGLVHFDRESGEKTELEEINLAIKDLLVADTSGEMIKSVSFTGSVDCKEVRKKNLRIGHLKAPVQAVKGIYSFHPLAIDSLVYFDRKAGEKAELKGINLAIKDLSVADTSGDVIKNVSFTGSMDCREVRQKSLRIDNVKSPLRMEKGVIYLTSLAMDIFGARGEGYATADTSKANAVYKLTMKVTKLDFEKLENSFAAQKVIGGKGDLYASLTLKEKESRALLSSLDGTLSLRGDNLVIHSMDIDKVLSKYGTIQEYNLVDIGVFFIVRPPGGNVALKDLYNKSWQGQGFITHFISHWKIKGGVANATDCAFATQHERVALKGKIDIVNERYDDVIVAILDDKGCAKFTQSISGPIGNPQISALSAVGSLAAPLANLYGKAKRFIQGGNCEVFYNGSVRQPR